MMLSAEMPEIMPEATPGATQEAIEPATLQASPKAIIDIRNLHKSFGPNPVLRGLDLGIQRGEALFLIGTSGVGKSVTIKHMVGLLRADSGEIWFDGKRIDGLGERQFQEVRKRMGMVLQSSTLFDSMTLRENLALPLRMHKRLHDKRLGDRDALEQAGERLAQVGLEEHADAYPTELSDGMRKRAAIARALTLDPEAILLDEPTTGMDPVSARRVDRLIRDLVDRLGMTAVVVSHDLESIMGIADRIAFLYQGRVHALGTREEFRHTTDPVVQQFMSGRATGPMETPGF